MIYVKEVFEKYRKDCPLAFSSQPPGFTFAKEMTDGQKAKLRQVLESTNLSTEKTLCCDGKCVLTDNQFNVLMVSEGNTVNCPIDHPVMTLAEMHGV